MAAAAQPKTALMLATGGEVLDLEKFEGYGTDAGAGFDNQTGEDVSIPFLVLMQPLSPEVQAEGSQIKAGMWLNKTTNEAYGEITFIPSYTEHVFVEWKPRDIGGGLVDQHAIDSPIVARCRAEQSIGSYKHPDMLRPGMSEDDLKKVNDIVETFYVYGTFINPEGGAQPAVIAFSSTHIKPYKDWMFRIRSVVIPLPNGSKLTSRQLPMWALAYKLGAMRVEKKPHVWFVPTVAFAGSSAVDSLIPANSELYEQAKSVYEGVKSGKQKAATETLSGSGAPVDAAPVKGDTDQAAAPY